MFGSGGRRLALGSLPVTDGKPSNSKVIRVTDGKPSDSKVIQTFRRFDQ